MTVPLPSSPPLPACAPVAPTPPVCAPAVPHDPLVRFFNRGDAYHGALERYAGWKLPISKLSLDLARIYSSPASEWDVTNDDPRAPSLISNLQSDSPDDVHRALKDLEADESLLHARGVPRALSEVRLLTADGWRRKVCRRAARQVEVVSCGTRATRLFEKMRDRQLVFERQCHDDVVSRSLAICRAAARRRGRPRAGGDEVLPVFYAAATSAGKGKGGPPTPPRRTTWFEPYIRVFLKSFANTELRRPTLLRLVVKPVPEDASQPALNVQGDLTFENGDTFPWVCVIVTRPGFWTVQLGHREPVEYNIQNGWQRIPNTKLELEVVDPSILLPNQVWVTARIPRAVEGEQISLDTGWSRKGEQPGKAADGDQDGGTGALDVTERAKTTPNPPRSVIDLFRCIQAHYGLSDKLLDDLWLGLLSHLDDIHWQSDVPSFARLIDRLSIQRQTVFLMRQIGMTHEEIALQLGVSPDSSQQSASTADAQLTRLCAAVELAPEIRTGLPQLDLTVRSGRVVLRPGPGEGGFPVFHPEEWALIRGWLEPWIAQHAPRAAWLFALLPLERRAVFVLRAGLRLHNEAAASRLGISPEQVDQHYTHCKKALSAKARTREQS